MADMENSVNTSGVTNSSHGSSAWMENSDSLALQEEWSGVSKFDLDLEITDPLQGIFYHLMPSKDDTTIFFYNKPLYNNLLTVLSKQFQFPSAETQTFTVKMHVKDKKACFLHIDKRIKSIRASGPGHLYWKENHFKKLSENMYKSFVKETNSVLNSSNTTDIQDNESLSASQVSTQPNKSGINYTATEGAEEEPPVELVAEQLQITKQLDPTCLRDTPVLHHITILIDMIHKQQSILSHLTQQVNRLVEQTANESVYKTIDQISADDTVQPSEVFEDPFHLATQEDGENNNAVQEQYHEANAPTDVEGPSSPNLINTDGLPSPSVQLPDLQTRSYSEVARTSTPKTPQRPSPASRQIRPQQNPGPSSDPITSKQILLIGDSLISSVNPKGLKQNVFRNGISGGKISHILNHMKMFDLNQFSTVIIYVGGNDAANGSDPELFEEKYDQLIRHIKGVNSQCQIFLCNLCPRGDTSTSEVNDLIKSLTEEHQIVMIDVDKTFHDSRNNVIRRYYDSDSIHLSSSGVKRLLNAINNKITIVQDYNLCSFNRRQQKNTKPLLGLNRTRKQHSHSGGRNFWARRREENVDKEEITNFCFKCGESNHDTISCKHKQQLKCFQCGLLGHKSGRCLPN